MENQKNKKQCIYIALEDMEIFKRLLAYATKERRGVGYVVCRAWEAYEGGGDAD